MIATTTTTTTDSSQFRPLGTLLDDNTTGIRLDSFLAQQRPFYSRQKWQKKLAQGELLVNGQTVRPSYRIKAGDEFSLYHPPCAEPEVDRGIYPLWRQGDVMAVFKPAGLPMHENGPYRRHTFAHILQEEFGVSWAAIHRLDRETSGIVLCAQTAKSRKELSRQLSLGLMSKEYLAISCGQPSSRFFREQGAIGDLTQSSIRIKKAVVAEGGLAAETWFEVLEQKGRYCLIRAQPKTGRTNQIRIHLAHQNLVIVGDKLYHPDERVFNEYFDQRGNTDWVVAQTGFHRLCLHAFQLCFFHPLGQIPCRVTCPLPEDLKTFWDHICRPS